MNTPVAIATYLQQGFPTPADPALTSYERRRGVPSSPNRTTEGPLASRHVCMYI